MRADHQPRGLAQAAGRRRRRRAVVAARAPRPARVRLVPGLPVQSGPARGRARLRGRDPRGVRQLNEHGSGRRRARTGLGDLVSALVRVCPDLIAVIDPPGALTVHEPGRGVDARLPRRRAHRRRARSISCTRSTRSGALEGFASTLELLRLARGAAARAAAARRRQLARDRDHRHEPPRPIPRSRAWCSTSATSRRACAPRVRCATARSATASSSSSRARASAWSTRSGTRRSPTARSPTCSARR